MRSEAEVDSQSEDNKKKTPVETELIKKKIFKFVIDKHKIRFKKLELPFLKGNNN